MKPTLNHLKTYFTFSKGERNGIIILMTILLVLIVSIKLIPKNSTGKDEGELFSFKKEVDSLFLNDTATNRTQIIMSPTFSAKKESNKPGKLLIIEINSSDSATLIKLRGIGPVFASRIVKYRNLLGGFCQLSQLKEVYGLKDENFAKASEQITVKSSLVKGISIDTAGFISLARHPYIGRDKAWQIIDFRTKKASGVISVEDIKNSNIFDSLQWQRVKPYLVFRKNKEPE